MGRIQTPNIVCLGRKARSFLAELFHLSRRLYNCSEGDRSFLSVKRSLLVPSRSNVLILSGEMKMQDGQENDIHYVIEGCFEDYEHLDSEFLLVQLIQEQETVYQSFETNYGNHQLGTSRSSDNHEQHANRKRVLVKDREDFDAKNFELQLALDESLAMTLQKMENEAVGTSSNDGSRSGISTNSSASNAGLNVTARTSLVNQDDVDPDNSTYEELQSLGESIGTHPRGLSDELISYLPSSKYKTGGPFSRKQKHEECVICCMEYKSCDKLITLPCHHMYHADCATRWLRINKVCPVCFAEVFGS